MGNRLPEYEIEMKNGLVRILFVDSKQKDQAGRGVLHGPWCASVVDLEDWWRASHTARLMRGEIKGEQQ